MKTVLFLSSTLAVKLAMAYTVIDDPNNPPHQTEEGQYGYNDCERYSDNPDSKCQTVWMNSLDDFCLFAPPSMGTIGDTERYAVSYCTKSGHGTRLIPEDTIRSAHFVHTDNFVQITGRLDQTQINVKKGDSGGEMDAHGADNKSNPIGGIVLGADKEGSLIQFPEWTSFLGNDMFCIRACYPDADKRYCQHIYDVMGCEWNEPGNYESGFDTCDAASGEPMGVYRQEDGSESTWRQGQKPTPRPHPDPASSNCQETTTIEPATYSPVQRMAARHTARREKMF